MSIVIGIGGPSNGGQGPSQIQRREAFHNVQPMHSALPPRSLTFPQCHSSLACPLQHQLVGEAEDIRRLVVNALIDHLVCFVACMVHHTSGDALGSVI